MTLLCVLTVIYLLIFIFDFRRVRLAENRAELWTYLILFAAAYIATAAYCIFSPVPTLTGF